MAAALNRYHDSLRSSPVKNAIHSKDNVEANVCAQQVPAEGSETEYQEVSPEHIRAFWHDEDGSSAMEDSMWVAQLHRTVSCVLQLSADILFPLLQLLPAPDMHQLTAE